MSLLMSSLGIDQLSPAERIQLIEDIWDSLPDLSPPELTAEQEQELTRRLTMMDANPTVLSSWAEVEARILRKLQ